MNLYNKIEKLCHDCGITITDMCKVTGASRGSLGDLKSGTKKVLSVGTLLKISKYFGLTVNELMSTENHRLYAARRIRGKSRQEIAEHLGIDISIYNHYEDACNAPAHILKAISVFLNVDLEFLNGTEYVLDFPVSSWSREDKDDYEDAIDVEKIVMEYKLGKIRYLTSLTPTTNEKETRVLVAYRSHPEMQSAVDKLLGIDSPNSGSISADIAEEVKDFITSQQITSTKQN
jgi:transcriptional regulator with XRE-family HTH domain